MFPFIQREKLVAVNHCVVGAVGVRACLWTWTGRTSWTLLTDRPIAHPFTHLPLKFSFPQWPAKLFSLKNLQCCILHVGMLGSVCVCVCVPGIPFVDGARFCSAARCAFGANLPSLSYTISGESCMFSAHTYFKCDVSYIDICVCVHVFALWQECIDRRK